MPVQVRGIFSGMWAHTPAYACTCGSRKGNILEGQPQNTSNNRLLEYSWVQKAVVFNAQSHHSLFFFYADVKIVGLGAQDKVAVIQSCPSFPGPPGPKGEPGSPAVRGSNLDGTGIPLHIPLASLPPVLPRRWDCLFSPCIYRRMGLSRQPREDGACWQQR